MGEQPLPVAALASQKNYMSLHLMGLYCGCEPGMDGSALEQWFHRAWAATGKKLDMGKACIRFKRLEDLSLEVIGEAIRRVPARRYIEAYRTARGTRPIPSAKQRTDRAPRRAGPGSSTRRPK